jgi:hypothetical protein
VVDGQLDIRAAVGKRQGGFVVGEFHIGSYWFPDPIPVMRLS